MANNDLDRLAAEYVLGTLARTERQRAERLRRRDPSFAGAVANWERRLSPLAEAVAPVPPPPGLWDRIAHALDARAEAAQAGSSIPVTQVLALQRSLAKWRSAAIAALATVMVLGAVLLGQFGLTGVPTSAERYVAMLQGEAGDTGYVVTVEPRAHRILVRSLGAAPPPQKNYELWMMMEDGAELIGIVREDSLTMPLPKTIRTAQLDRKAKVVVCVEPEGGQPPPGRERIMGPIVYAGELVRQTP